MKIVLSALAVFLLSGCCSLVWAADDFGPRFGSNAPYALQNDFTRAQNDVRGIGLDDLNDVSQIEPAAGGDDESPNAEQAEDEAYHDAQQETPENAPSEAAE